MPIRPINPSEALRLRCKGIETSTRLLAANTQDRQVMEFYDDLERFFADLEHYIHTVVTK